MIEANKMINYAIFFFLGAAVSNLAYDLRFMNPYLRRELLLTIGNGEPYFYLFAMFDMLAVAILSTILLIFKADDKNKARRKNDKTN